MVIKVETNENNFLIVVGKNEFQIIGLAVSSLKDPDELSMVSPIWFGFDKVVNGELVDNFFC